MRVGFCCKWIDSDDQINGIRENDNCRPLSTRGTTVAWLNRQSKSEAYERLEYIVAHNIESMRLLVERVGGLDPLRRMVRIGSDILPMYTEPTWQHFYEGHNIRSFMFREFARVGDLARELDVRLSFHPGEFTVLASDRPDVVKRSIEEFEYHADMIRYMGYGRDFQDIKCNVHISGRQGPNGIRLVLPQLSVEARNSITIENSEMNWGIEASLELADDLALVLDIHHHWVKTGEYIQPDDPRVARVRDSWRGRRPVIHYSQSRRDRLPYHDPSQLPDHASLLASGHSRTSLRAHSDYFWNQASNEWAASFLPEFDIQTESKAKNLARDRFIENVVYRSLVTL